LDHVGAGQGEGALGVEGVDIGARDHDFGHAGIQLVDVDPPGLEVHGPKPEGIGTEAQVDVFGDEDCLVLGIALADVEGDAQDQVIGDLVLAQRGDGRHHPLSGGDPELAAVGQGGSFSQLRATGPIPVEHARHLARIATALRCLLLELVYLLENEDGDHHLVVIELQDRAGIVNENIGVEDEMFWHGPNRSRPRNDTTTCAHTGRPARVPRARRVRVNWQDGSRTARWLSGPGYTSRGPG
jgi:hypothetical protein